MIPAGAERRTIVAQTVGRESRRDGRRSADVNHDAKQRTIGSLLARSASSCRRCSAISATVISASPPEAPTSREAVGVEQLTEKPKRDPGRYQTPLRRFSLRRFRFQHFLVRVCIAGFDGAEDVPVEHIRTASPALTPPGSQA
jgi:hypothetical protein